LMLATRNPTSPTPNSPTLSPSGWYAKLQSLNPALAPSGGSSCLA
jgi:hypothetical protein